MCTPIVLFGVSLIERHSGATTGVRNGDPTSFIEQLSTHDPG
jgi:hypothetical protein